jgi:hypothetical protein
MLQISCISAAQILQLRSIDCTNAAEILRFDCIPE